MNTENTREEAKSFLEANGYPNPDSNFVSEMLDTMVEYAEYKLKNHDLLADVSKCQYCMDVNTPKGDEYCNDCKEQLKDI